MDRAVAAFAEIGFVGRFAAAVEEWHRLSVRPYTNRDRLLELEATMGQLVVQRTSAQLKGER